MFPPRWICLLFAQFPKFFWQWLLSLLMNVHTLPFIANPFWTEQEGWMDGCAPISVRLFKSQTKYYSSSFAILQRGVRGLCISFCRWTSHHITVCRVDAFLLCTRAPAKWSSILARITSACITTSNIWKGNWLGLLNALAEPQQKPFNLPKH